MQAKEDVKQGEAGQPEQDAIHSSSEPHTGWAELIPPDQWQIYREAIEAAQRIQVPFLLAGAFGLAFYTERVRNTKDLDLLVLPEHRDQLVAELRRTGFVDYHSTIPYDRSWIDRSIREGVIVDVIWTFPNHRMEVDARWFERAKTVQFREYRLQVVPAEELLWIKLFVFQRDRCDWPDILNLLATAGPKLDWDYLLERLGPDVPLLQGVLAVFGWLSPQRAAALPAHIRKLGGIGTAPKVNGTEHDRVRALDSRPWFAAYQPKDQPMQL